MCANVPGLGASKCDSDEVLRVTCPVGLNQCMSMIGELTVFTLTLDVELKNCSNSDLCDPASDYYGKNGKELAPLPFPMGIRQAEC